MRGTVRCAKRGCNRVRTNYVCECGNVSCVVVLYWKRPGERTGRQYIYRRDSEGILRDYDRASNLLALLHNKINDKRKTFDPEELLAANIDERRFEMQVKAWLAEKKQEADADELSFETLKNYRGYAKHHWTFFNGHDVKEIGTTELKHFVSGLRFKGLKIKTRKNILLGLRTFFGWLREKGPQYNGIAELPSFPTIGGEDGRQRTAIDYETQTAALNRIPEEHRDVIEFGFETGLRPGELCALQVGDLDLSQGKLLVQRTWSGPRLRETTKGKMKRFIPLSLRAREIAGTHLKDKLPGAWLFVNPETHHCYRPKKLNFIWREFSGLDIDHYSAGRHSFCTQLLEDGANIFEAQELMRHADIHSTRKYAHLSTSRLEAIVNSRGRVKHLKEVQQHESNTTKGGG